MKKALIFNPYLDTLGGGEFYTFLIVEFLLKNKYGVELAWHKNDLLNKINSRFNSNFNNRVIINNKAWQIFTKKKNLFKKYIFTKKYQLIFYISDGSIPFLFAKKNYLLFQSPFKNVKGRSLINQIKLSHISSVFCYSHFVKRFIDQEFRIKAKVLYPAINDLFFRLKKIKKENIILLVGRFDQIMNAKKQDVLVNAFKQMLGKGIKGWQLVLIGGLIKETDYFKRLKKQIKGYPIKIIVNADFNVLKSYYQKAKIYWHAAGFGENLKLHPEKAEHFGISVVEAMASSCLPVVFKEGGIPEIVGSQQYLWKTIKELKGKTKFLIKNYNLSKKLKKQLKKRALHFSKERFFLNLKGFIG